MLCADKKVPRWEGAANADRRDTSTPPALPGLSCDPLEKYTFDWLFVSIVFGEYFETLHTVLYFWKFFLRHIFSLQTTFLLLSSFWVYFFRFHPEVGLTVGLISWPTVLWLVCFFLPRATNIKAGAGVSGNFHQISPNFTHTYRKYMMSFGKSFWLRH